MEHRIDKLIDLIKTLGFTIANQNTCTELINRLNRVKSQYNRLIQLNKECLANNPLKIDVDFNEETEVMSVMQHGEILLNMKLHRTNPNVPIKLRGKSDMNGFIPEEEQEQTKDNMKLLGKEKEIELAKELEDFYYNASKLWNLFEESLCKKKNAEFIGVKMVRNKLIEHAEDGDVYSFGFSEAWGPSVKPEQLAGRREKWHDKGLKVNTHELISKIEQGLDSLVKNSTKQISPAILLIVTFNRQISKLFRGKSAGF